MEFDEYVVDLNADCKCGCMSSNRFHKIYRFPNGYGASVVNNPHSGTYGKEGYRAMLLKFSGPEEYSVEELPGFGTDVVDCATWDDAVETLGRVKSL